LLTVISDYGFPNPSGVATNAAGLPITAYLAGSPEETPGVVQYECTGWTRTGSTPASGTGTNTSFTITEDTTITWQWLTNYWIELNTVGE